MWRRRPGFSIPGSWPEPRGGVGFRWQPGGSGKRLEGEVGHPFPRPGLAGRLGGPSGGGPYFSDQGEGGTNRAALPRPRAGGGAALEEEMGHSPFKGKMGKKGEKEKKKKDFRG